MNKTKIKKADAVQKVLVDTEELKFMLSCGRVSALKIGEKAESKVYVGRRVLWNARKIEAYLDKMEQDTLL